VAFVRIRRQAAETKAIKPNQKTMKFKTKAPLGIIGLAVAAALGSYANAASIMIKPTNAAASVEYGGRPAGDTLNDTQSTLDTGAPIPSTLPTVKVVKTDNWLALQGPPIVEGIVDDQWIVYDLGDTYDVNGIYVWNYWDSPANGSTQGAKDVDVLFATTLNNTFGTQASVDNDFSGLISAVFPEMTDVTSNQGTGGLVDLGSATTARYVLFNINTNHGHPDRVGLGEIRFTNIPEPSSLALLGFGSLLFLRRRR
jgi:hypothetical protein